jgi:hypothetical protein
VFPLALFHFLLQWVKEGNDDQGYFWLTQTKADVPGWVAVLSHPPGLAILGSRLRGRSLPAGSSTLCGWSHLPVSSGTSTGCSFCCWEQNESWGGLEEVVVVSFLTQRLAFQSFSSLCADLCYMAPCWWGTPVRKGWPKKATEFSWNLFLSQVKPSTKSYKDRAMQRAPCLSQVEPNFLSFRSTRFSQILNHFPFIFKKYVHRDEGHSSCYLIPLLTNLPNAFHSLSQLSHPECLSNLFH